MIYFRIFNFFFNFSGFTVIPIHLLNKHDLAKGSETSLDDIANLDGGSESVNNDKQTHSKIESSISGYTNLLKLQVSEELMLQNSDGKVVFKSLHVDNIQYPKMIIETENISDETNATTEYQKQNILPPKENKCKFLLK